MGVGYIVDVDDVVVFVLLYRLIVVYDWYCIGDLVDECVVGVM